MLRIRTLLLFVVIYSLSALSSFAQIEEGAFGYFREALRFSQTSFGGTARFQSIAGAGTALGGDMSALHLNPAGLGFYKKSDVSLTLGIGSENTSSVFIGENSDAKKGNLNVGNIGAVLSRPLSFGNWQYLSYGIALNRINNFNRTVTYSGVNNENSMIDFFLEQVNGTPIQNLEAQEGNILDLNGLAYYSYLIDYDDINKQYYSFIPALPMSQEGSLETKGGQNQIDLSIGANYDHTLFLGASLGIATLNYRSVNKHKETTISNDPNTPLNNFTLTDELKIEGAGLNLRLGAIYRPNDVVQLGLSLQTPTYYRLTESYKSSIRAIYNNYEYQPNFFLKTVEAQTIPGDYEYNLITPFRANVGLAIFAGKNGFISGDVEYLNYGQSRISSDDGSDFDPDNKTIRNLYGSAVNFRVGGEYNYRVLRFRAGYAHYGDPFKDNVDALEDRSSRSITGGIGVRLDRFYIDAAFVHTDFKSGYSPYRLQDNSHYSVVTDHQANRVMLTFGMSLGDL